MNKQILKQPNDERLNTVTPEWLSSYIFWSFYYSQGSAQLQDNLDQYATAKYPAMGNVMAANEYAVIESVAQKIARFAQQKGDNKHVGYNFKAASIAQTPPFLSAVHHRFESIIEKSETPERCLPADTLVALMLKRELQLLTVDGVGEPGLHTNPSHPRFAKDTISSHVVGSTSAHHPVFDELFAEARGALQLEGVVHPAQELLGQIATAREVLLR